MPDGDVYREMILPEIKNQSLSRSVDSMKKLLKQQKIMELHTVLRL